MSKVQHRSLTLYGMLKDIFYCKCYGYLNTLSALPKKLGKDVIEKNDKNVNGDANVKSTSFDILLPQNILHLMEIIKIY